MTDIRGDSLSARDLLEEVRSRGIELWLEGRRLRFRAPGTGLPADLRERIAEVRAEVSSLLREESSADVRIEAIGPNQVGIWHEQQLSPSTTAYNIGIAYSPTAEVDGALLAEAVQVLVDRHDILRTDYPEVDGTPVRRVVGYRPADVTRSSLDGSTTVPEGLRRIAAAPLALDSGPPFRVHLVQTPDAEVILIVAHHLTLDGLSLRMLARELLATYRALERGESLPASRSERSAYAEWVASQQAWLADTGPEASRFWASVLEPPPGPLALPLDRPHQSIAAHRGATRHSEVPPEIVHRLTALCREHGYSPFVGVLAAYVATLRALTGHDDVTVGTPVHGRSAARFAATLGHLVNVVPVRLRDLGDLSFLQIMEAVREFFRLGAPYQDYPLPRIAWDLAEAHGGVGAPVQTFFALHDFRRFSEFREDPRASASATREVRFDQLEGQFDLSLEVFYEADGLQCEWRFDPDSLDGSTIDGWSSVFGHLLEDLLDAPGMPLHEVALRSDGPQSTLLGRESPLPDEGVRAVLARRAVEHPDRVAVDARNGSYTYAEIHAASQAVTAGLRDLDVGPGDFVGVAVDRGRDLIPALLGVHGAGAAYVPLDPVHPEGRLKEMLLDAGAVALVTHRGLAEALEVDLPVLDLDRLDRRRTAHTSPTEPGAAAYATFTSGSTGKPKAVVVPHRAVINLLESMAEEPGMSGSDVLLAVTTVAFDISVLELFLPLMVGARVVIAAEDEVRNGEALAQRLDNDLVTVMQATPTTWKLLLDTGWSGKSDLRVFCGGESLTPALAEELEGRVAELWNMYGPTETTVWSTVHRLRSGIPVSIGSPIANTVSHVRDRRMRPVPVGFTGELCLGGAGTAIGYLNRPDLTAERFIEDPLSDSRLYRTGDLVRQRPDGTLQHLGRLDDQVKVRGFRIEPGEVESALRGHEAVRDVAVAARQVEGEDAELVAWIVPSGPPLGDLRDLGTHLRRDLPSYMVPTLWAEIDSLPLTRNGKVDRRALETPDRVADVRSSTSDSSLATGQPRNAAEEVLLEIWRQVLGRDAIGVFDDFFELGGHSLRATMIAARVRAVFDVELPLRQIFADPTVAGLAEWVRSAQGTIPSRVSITRRENRSVAPLSFSQERMWFLQQLSPTDASYNLAMGTILNGPFDRERLMAALSALEERHPVLRSRIVSSRGRPQQIVGPSGLFEVKIEDVSGGPTDVAVENGLALVTEHLYRPYDLESEPPLRLVFVKLDTDRELLGLGLHHVVGDQGSFEILIQELSELYARGPGADLPPLSIDYGDFATWQRERFSDDALSGPFRYWREALADLPPLDLPTDRPRPKIRGHTGDRVTMPIPVATMGSLRELSVESQATPFMLLLSAYAVLLHSRSRQTDIPIGVPAAHRDEEDLEGLVGSFVNTLVYRIDLTGNPTFREVVARVRETALAAIAHQDLPFDLLVRDLDPPRDASRTPLFQVMFNLANVRVGEGGMPGFEAESLHLPHPVAQFDLTLIAEINERRQEYQLNYSTELFDTESAVAMLHQYAEVLDRGLADPSTRLSTLASAPQSERWLLQEWNRTERKLPDAASVVHRLVERAALHPDRVAVEDATGSWSYREVTDRAAAVAGGLRSLGVEPGDRVGVVAERGRELVAGLLGIWGAGAAYVPLDPTHPTVRLQMMLDDSDAVAIVSHRGLAIPLGSQLPALDLDATTPSHETLPLVHPEPDQSAYVIYTSGSTGTPKGVEVPHGAVTNFLGSMADEPGLEEDDVLLAVTTISFDISILELFLPLSVGARAVIASDEDVRDGNRLVERLGEFGVTVMQATPSTWKLMIAAGWEGSSDLRVLCGGESLSADLAADLAARCGTLWNMYGPTETTVWSSIQRVESGEPILVGRPIANTTFHVLDAEGAPVPIGVPGELHIGGRGVATGYVGQPRLTAERFITTSIRPGETLYRTGDLVRYHRDGRVEHLGRLDHQVKVRGYRVELGEVEARLRSHADVVDAVVVNWQDRLVAYIRNRAGSATTAAELRSWTSSRLPTYMVPSLFVTLDTFPLTASGKVDRNGLPDPTRRVATTTRNRPLSSPTERGIAGVWKDLLGVSAVSADDNFFELGGHSLLAMEATALVQERVGVQIDPREMFFKTLRQLADATGSDS